MKKIIFTAAVLLSTKAFALNMETLDKAVRGAVNEQCRESRVSPDRCPIVDKVRHSYNPLDWGASSARTAIGGFHSHYDYIVMTIRRWVITNSSGDGTVGLKSYNCNVEVQSKGSNRGNELSWTIESVYSDSCYDNATGEFDSIILDPRQTDLVFSPINQ